MGTNEIQKATKNLGNMLAKNSPTILTGMGVAGLLTTTVMAVRATPKALELLEAEKDRIYKDWDGPREEIVLSNKTILDLTWKCYLPAAITGAITIGCIISANSINLKRNAALAGLYSLSEAAMKEYQAKVVETIGKNKERAIKDDIAKDKIHKNPVSDNEIVITGKGDTLCYDALSGRYFKSDIEEIKRAMNKLSRDLLSDMFISLNDIYSELDLRGTNLGDMVGWHVDDGLIEPRFSSQLTENGTPCLVMDFDVEPRYNYRD